MRAFESIQFTSLQPGPRLIVTGAVHGNETCGTVAVRRVLDDIEQGRLNLVAGTVTFVPVSNPLAYAKRQREGDRNLNRKLAPTAEPHEFEDHVANWLCPLLAQHDALLDLHAFRTPGEAFAMIGPENNTNTLEPFTHAAREQALVARLGVHRIVDGWLSTYAAGVEQRRKRLAIERPQADDLRRPPPEGGKETWGGPAFPCAGQPALEMHADYGVGTTEFMRRSGGWAITLECGQLDDAHAPQLAYQAIRNTLAHLGLSDEPDPPPANPIEGLRLFQVVDKQHELDRFTRAWASFDAVQAGELIALRHDGTPLHAPSGGRVVFPNPAAEPGKEWYYLARPQGRFGA